MSRQRFWSTNRRIVLRDQINELKNGPAIAQIEAKNDVRFVSFR